MYTTWLHKNKSLHSRSTKLRAYCDSLSERSQLVLDYAYWRTKKANTNPFVLVYDQPIHPLFSRNHLCLRPGQTGKEALEFF